jgi:hypothetical protein
VLFIYNCELELTRAALAHFYQRASSEYQRMGPLEPSTIVETIARGTSVSFLQLLCEVISDHKSRKGLLSDLAGAVRRIADQYTIDCPPHYLPAAGHADDGVFLDFSLVSSNPVPSKTYKSVIHA